MVFKKLPSIHFILPGGGVKGCFQAGFIFRLISLYSEKFTVYQVDCTSVGALNGLAFICDKKYINNLKEIWFSIKNMNDIFCNISSSILLPSVLSHFYSVGNKALFSSEPLKKIIDNFSKKIKEEKKNIYNCTVLNINSGNTEYVNGNNSEINKYILASSAVWIIAPPIEINNILYSDGGLKECVPLKYIHDSEADYKLIIGYAGEFLNKEGKSGDNIYTYISRLINISNFDHNLKCKEIINENNNLIKINLPEDIDSFDFNPEIIKKNFIKGIIKADEFAEKYLNNFDKLN